MSISEQRLAEIKARVSAATTGPWIVLPEKCGPGGQVIFQESSFGPICETADPSPRGGNRPTETFDFIAHSITDVADLVAEVERLRERLEVAKRDRNKIQDDRVRLETQLAYYVTNGGGNQGLIDNLREENCRILKLDVGLHTEIERLRKALEWYAADTNYIGYEDSDVMVDRGRRAIAALEVSDDNPAGG
jgi:hypothetical protein